MKANFEIKYVREGKQRIIYKTLDIYKGIVADLYDKYEQHDCTDINIRMI